MYCSTFNASYFVCRGKICSFLDQVLTQLIATLLGSRMKRRPSTLQEPQVHFRTHNSTKKEDIIPVTNISFHEHSYYIKFSPNLYT